MGRVYDNWGRLVEAVVRRELLIKLSLQSEPPSSRSSDSEFSSSTSSYRYDDAYFTSSHAPLHPDDLRLKLEQITHDSRPGVSLATVPNKRSNLWKGLFIFRRLLASKKENRKEETKPKWVNGKRAFHGHEPVKSYSMGNSSQVEEEANRNSELERLKELYTLQGHIQALVRAKGLDESMREPKLSSNGYKVPTKRRSLWKGLLIFSRFFSSKKDYNERESKLEQARNQGIFCPRSIDNLKFKRNFSSHRTGWQQELHKLDSNIDYESHVKATKFSQ